MKTLLLIQPTAISLSHSGFKVGDLRLPLVSTVTEWLTRYSERTLGKGQPQEHPYSVCEVRAMSAG